VTCLPKTWISSLRWSLRAWWSVLWVWMVSRRPLQILQRVTASMSSTAVRVVLTVQGDIGCWEFDLRQMGRAGKEAQDALGVPVRVVWTLDIVVIVVPAVLIIAEVRMLKSMSMSWMAVSSRGKIMELVSGVWQVMD
jgi:hypothetical protein